LTFGQTTNGELTSDDDTGFRGYYDVYITQGARGLTVVIQMTSNAGDPYMLLQGPEGEILEESTLSGSGARIGTVDLEAGTVYRVIATSEDDGATFPYEISMRQAR